MQDATKFERWLAAAVLLGGPLAGLVGGLMVGDFGEEMAGELAFVSAHTGRWVASNLLTLLMGALMTPAVLVLLLLVREGSRVLGYGGAGLALVGLYAHGAVVGYSMVEAPLVDSALGAERVLAFVDGPMYNHAAFSLILFPFLGFFLGMLLLAAALWRAGVVPLWVAGVMAAAPLSEFLGPATLSPELMFVLFGVAFAYVARGVLSGERWNHRAVMCAQPSAQASRPLAGCASGLDVASEARCCGPMG